MKNEFTVHVLCQSIRSIEIQSIQSLAVESCSIEIQSIQSLVVES